MEFEHLQFLETGVISFSKLPLNMYDDLLSQHTQLKKTHRDINHKILQLEAELQENVNSKHSESGNMVTTVKDLQNQLHLEKAFTSFRVRRETSTRVRAE